MTLQKTWINSSQGDTAELTIDGTSDDSATAVATGVPMETFTETASITALSGETLVLAEDLGDGNRATYVLGLECTQPGLTHAAGESSGTFTVSPTPVGVTCTFTNTLAGEIVVTKRVEQATAGLPWSFDIVIDPVTLDVVSPQTVAGTGNTTATATFTHLVPGTTYTLTETAVAGWTAGAFACVVTHFDGSTELATGTITIRAGDQVACDVTNIPVGELAITKEVTSGPTRNADGTLHARLRRRRLQPGRRADRLRPHRRVPVRRRSRRRPTTSVENVEPGDIAVNDAFDGDANQAIASATLAAGASHRYRITVTANVSAVATAAAFDCNLDPGESGTGFLNRATVNPSAEDCAPIDGMADVRVTKNVNRTQVTVNPSSTDRTRLTYTIEVRNAGPGTATDVVVTDTLPGGVVPVSAVPSVGTCTRAGAVLTCPLGTLAAGATAEIAVTIDLLPTQPVGTVRNTVAVDSSSFDPDTSNNNDVALTEVTVGGGSTAITGAQIGTIIAIAAVLLVVGWLMLVLRRRPGHIT